MKQTKNLAVLALALAGCGGGGGESDDVTTGGRTGASPAAGAPDTAEPSPKPAAPPSGADVVARLEAASLPVTLGSDFDEATDPNNLLGRPGGYLDKVTFTDSRNSDQTYPKDSVELGGSVEVFEDAAGAETWAEFIKEVSAGNAALTEYDVVDGPVLLRLSRELTPLQVAAYEAALKQ